MDENRVIWGGIVAAIVAVGVVMAVVRGPTLTGMTPIQAALFAILGVAVPQGIIAFQNRSRFHGGVAGLAFVGGVAAIGYGISQGSLVARPLPGFMTVLLGGVVLAWLVGVGRSFLTGFRTATE
jgi:hypothetical protein